MLAELIIIVECQICIFFLNNAVLYYNTERHKKRAYEKTEGDTVNTVH